MDAAGALDSSLSELAAAGGFRGAVRVERSGDVLLDRAYGEDGAGVSLTTGTALQIASISKSFTAACVLLLVDRGRLPLDDRLVSFLDAVPDAWREITIRHLLTHTSGLVHWHEVPGHDHYRPIPRAELIARFSAAPLLFEPGSSWSYSSPGFVLLGHIAETVAGMPYPAFLGAEVLQPLGLEHTSAEKPPLGIPAAHGSRAGELVPSFDLSVNVATGDVWSTTGDLVRWPSALASFASLSEEIRGEIFSEHVATTRELEGLPPIGYGYGWFTTELGGERLVFHSGDNAGFVSLLVWAPEQDLRLALLAADEVDLQPLALPALAGLLTEASTPRGTS
jgi:CubicO group peptidase (beta-lactamase class C family)